MHRRQNVGGRCKLKFPTAAILDYLNDEASAEEAAELLQWVAKSPENALEFARACALHADLRERLCGERRLRESGEMPILPPLVPTRPIRNPSRMAWNAILALAACCMLALGLRYGWPNRSSSLIPTSQSTKQGNRESSPVENSFVTLVQSSDANWGQSKNIEDGERLGRGELKLESGIVRIRFDDGVEVTLHGPSEYELLELGKTRLASGLLTANVPPGAEGFQVDTPSGQVVDLGTAFGIDLSRAGLAGVVVFEGQVEVTPQNQTNKQLLSEGESILMDTQGMIRSTQYATTNFEKLWPVSSGIAGSTGAFRFAPQWPHKVARIQSDSEIFVLPEGHVTRLAERCSVDLTESGSYRLDSELTPGEIDPGTRLRSFLLLFHPASESPLIRDPNAAQRIVGSITFARPVLGVILDGEALRASDIQFLGRVVRVPSAHRGLELHHGRMGDRLTLSPDRRTVTLDLAAFGQHSDHVRILVDASAPPDGRPPHRRHRH